MKNNMIAAALLASLSILSTPALAQNDTRAQLRLTVVDEHRAPLVNAMVTLSTMYGDRTVTTDEKGVVVIADLPAASTEWWVRTPGHASITDAERLKPGQNKLTVTLRTWTALSETESGS
jgi:hypothetical protein